METTETKIPNNELTFKDRIRMLSEYRGQTMEDFAKINEIDDVTLVSWINGDTKPDPITIVSISEKYGVESNFLGGASDVITPLHNNGNDTHLLRPASPEYERNIWHLRHMINKYRENADICSDDPREQAILAVACLSDELIEGIFALIRLERQMYEHAIMDEIDDTYDGDDSDLDYDYTQTEDPDYDEYFEDSPDDYDTCDDDFDDNADFDI